MDTKNSIGKLNQHLHLINSALNDSVQLKAEILAYLSNSEEKLIIALRDQKNYDEITKLKEALEDARCAYANCELYIIAYQANGIATKIEIKRLERQLKKSELNSKKNFSNFYSKRKEDDSDNDEFQVSSGVCQSSQTARLCFIGN